MAENSRIAWTDSTINVWLGCMQVVLVDPRTHTSIPSECDNCYAMWLVRNRMGYRGEHPDRPELWGDPKTTPRHQTKYWRRVLPLWNADAIKNGRLLVFSFSLSDWAEEHPMVGEWRADFLRMAAQCKHLDFQMLTKRPQNVLRMVPQEWLDDWPQNVWIGTSAGTRAAWNRRVPWLMPIRSAGCPVTFVSVEPTLEDMELAGDSLLGDVVNWVIDGGESGSPDGIDRPRIDSDQDWFRRIRDACVSAGVPYFHKQSSGNRSGMNPELDGRTWHQWPDVDNGVELVGGVGVGGVRRMPGAELIVPGARLTRVMD